MKFKTAIVTAVLLVCAMAAGAGERSLPLRNSEPEVLRQYESLQFMDRQQLRGQMERMTPKMRADVWTVHLLRVMREHPELTAEQRSLIYEGLGLIAAGIFEIDRTSREWTAQGRPTLLDLTRRIQAAFPPELSRALTTDPRDSVMTAPSPGDRLNRFRIGAQGACECSIFLQTDCQDRGVCNGSFPFCMPYHSCGPWMSDTCDGVCS